jgi:hypothetical protein
VSRRAEKTNPVGDRIPSRIGAASMRGRMARVGIGLTQQVGSFRSADAIFALSGGPDCLSPLFHLFFGGIRALLAAVLQAARNLAAAIECVSCVNVTIQAL